jgi:hypothetical protein
MVKVAGPRLVHGSIVSTLVNYSLDLLAEKQETLRSCRIQFEASNVARSFFIVVKSGPRSKYRFARLFS